MELVAFVIACALIEYMIFGVAVGRARTEHGVNAPAVTGPPVFERTMRAHQNTLENLVVFIPAVYLFAVYVHVELAAAIGVVCDDYFCPAIEVFADHNCARHPIVPVLKI